MKLISPVLALAIFVLTAFLWISEPGFAAPGRWVPQDPSPPWAPPG
jgi:hypothetical protein